MGIFLVWVDDIDNGLWPVAAYDNEEEARKHKAHLDKSRYEAGQVDEIYLHSKFDPSNTLEKREDV